MDLKDFFAKYNKVAIAFSGGVDSSYLLYSAIKNNVDAMAYYVKSDFQPEFEFQDAINLAEELNANMKILKIDVLDKEEIATNPYDRCYYCKQEIFGTILKEAKKDGFDVLLDGTNYSDSYEDRPGMKAKEELQVLSPLRECKLTKENIRALSKVADLPTWSKPSYSCLATRVMTNTTISKEILLRTEKAEDYLRSKGFTDFRVRNISDDAKIQVLENELEKVLELRKDILEELSKYYKNIVLDLEVRKGE